MHQLRRAAAGVAIAVSCLLPVPGSGAATLKVPAGGDLHAALLNARPGDVIELEEGATFVGNFTLHDKPGAAFITIRTGGIDAVGAGVRVTPEAAVRFAKLRSPNNQPVLQTAPGAHHWRLELLELQANARGEGDILALGSGEQTSLSMVPHDLIVDRLYIHGDPAVGQKRGIALNSASTTITNSYISDCKRVGQDAQAIAGWNGPGPFVIRNNYLEGAGENVIFGGADPAIKDLVPADIVISGNLLSKPLAWRDERWQVKNLLELKNARRVTIADNVLQNNWHAAQVGFAVLFTVRNQDGRCPWCQVDHVVFERNLVRNSASAVSILGVDYNHPSRQVHAITIRDNVFAGIDSRRFGGGGYAIQIVNGPRDLIFDHNTIDQEHGLGILQVEGPPVFGFTFTNNLARHHAYGIKGADRATGLDTIAAFFPASRIVNNVIAGGDPARYPRDNFFPSPEEFARQFVDYEAGDYRIRVGSPWRGAGSDGRHLGADLGGPPSTPPARPAVRPRQEGVR
jgi:hypothetical protein